MNLEALNRWTAEHRFTIDAGEAAAFAAATNDPDERRLRGDAIAPMFSVVPARGPALEALRSLIPDDELEGLPGLHGEQDMFFHRPLLPGLELAVRATTRGVLVKPTTTLIVILVRIDDRGKLIGEHWITTVFPALGLESTAGCSGPEHALPARLAARAPDSLIRQQTDVDQTWRYAAAAKDPTLFHIDEAEARRAGLPGLVLHGLCTMAFCAHGLSASRDLRRLAVRFSAPVRPGAVLETRSWQIEAKTSAFESVADGTTVIRNGRAEFH
jgi:acyl dehydratase